MKSGTGIITIGSAMIILGLVLFYLIQVNTNSEPVFRSIKHAGTFIGLMGIGVTVAGILLYLINRNQPLSEGNSDYELR